MKQIAMLTSCDVSFIICVFDGIKIANSVSGCQPIW